jgi:26S proteasome regulatory subunit N2
MNLGGRNCKINLLSSSGNNKMAAIVGMALFTQYYYWFPMIHFINLAVDPVILFGVDTNLRIPKNFRVHSQAKPSLYGYPEEAKLEEKSIKKEVATAILSTIGRAKNRNKRLGTSTSINADATAMNIDDRSVSQNLIPNLDKELKEKEEKEIKEKEKANTVAIDEPSEEYLNNPCRILPKQIPVCNVVENDLYRPILTKRFNGFVMLNGLKDLENVEYFDELEKKEVNKTEENKENTNDINNQGQGYQPVPSSDVEMPEEIDLSTLNKK